MRTLLALVLLAGMAMPSVAASNRYSQALYIPVSRNNIADVNLKNIRAEVGRVSNTASATLLHSGAGRVLGICMAGVAAGTYALAYDTTATDVASAVPSAAGASLLSPAVFAPGTGPTTTMTTQNQASPCWYPPYPVPYSSGLVVVNSATGAVATVLYQKD